MKKIFSFKGRISRLQYNSHVIISTLFVAIIFLLIYYLIVSTKSQSIGNYLIIIFYITLFLYASTLLSSTVLRFHDLDMTGFNVIKLLAPIVNFIYFFELIFKEGTNGANTYGEDSNKFSTFIFYNHFWNRFKDFYDFRKTIQIVAIFGLLITLIVYYNWLSEIPAEFREESEIPLTEKSFYVCIADLKSVSEHNEYCINLKNKIGKKIIEVKNHNHLIMFVILDEYNPNKLLRILKSKKYNEQNNLYFHDALIKKEYQIIDNKYYIQAGDVDYEIYELLKVILINCIEDQLIDDLLITYTNEN